MNNSFALLLSSIFAAAANAIGQGDWFDQWGGVARTVDGSSFLKYDPEDPRTTFRGSGSIEIEGGIMRMKGSPRLYVENTGNRGWRNVQVAGYAKVVRDDGANQLTGLTVGARSNHGNYKNDGCDAFGYYARIYYATGECTVQKEYYHDDTDTKVHAPSIRKQCFPEGRVPLDTWVGLKFTVETIPGDESAVFLGLYLDYGDGNGWNLALNFTDSQDSWPAIGTAEVLDQCPHKSGDPALDLANDCFFRSDGSQDTEVHWKDAHIINSTPSRRQRRNDADKDTEQKGGRKRSYTRGSSQRNSDSSDRGRHADNSSRNSGNSGGRSNRRIRSNNDSRQNKRRKSNSNSTGGR